MQTGVIPWEDIRSAAEVYTRAVEFTHPLFRYPASFSPYLARSLIAAFTRPGDIVLDPFCGGGTTAIEAVSQGRQSICSDVNALACFVTAAKATPLGTRSLDLVAEWVRSSCDTVLRRPIFRPEPLVLLNGEGRAPRTHGLLLQMRDSAASIKSPVARRFALLIVLRVGQICFDCRRQPPSPNLLRSTFEQVSSFAMFQMGPYAAVCREQASQMVANRNPIVYRTDAALLKHKLDTDTRVSLVLSSPPYPGVHVLYHRWQLCGRKETSLPYRLLGLEDGHQASHYTLGARGETENRTYFRKITDIYRNLRPLLRRNGIVAQVVGFSKPERQLDQFYQAMEDAGYVEIKHPRPGYSPILRTAPNRRWYACKSPKQDSAQEYLLLHTPKQ